ncbi:MAG: hypothetical protein AABM42_12065 [Actinomycetota bacterium]
MSIRDQERQASEAESRAEAERERRREDAREERAKAIAKAEAKQAEAQREADDAYRRRNLAEGELRNLHAEHGHLRADALAGVDRLREAAWELACGEPAVLARELALATSTGSPRAIERLLRVVGLILASGRSDVHEALRELITLAPAGPGGVSDLTRAEFEVERDRLRKARGEAERDRQRAVERKSHASRALTAAHYGEAA